ncbi:MAG: MopE-related protein [bacterium]
MTDINNCGGCYRACAFFRGVGACVAGQCELSACQGGYVDKDGNPDNGCECLMGVVEGATTCDATNPCTGGDVCADVNNDGVSHCGPVPEDVCDGVDNDCDGVVDEDAPAQLSGTQCWTHPVGCTADASGIYTCVGECQAGVPTCVGGAVICGFQVPPAAEICDELDNDCNGVVDEGYDKQNDPANCGTCNNQCLLANAVPACVAGQCVVAGCLPDHWDLNGNPADGCEYACQLSNAGSEACGDGLDNDCNGLIDDGFNFQIDANNCGSCGYNCTTVKPFGTQLTGCAGGACQFACQANYFDLNGDLAAGENGNGCEYFCVQSGGGVEVCDGLDNDCDGSVDEGFDLTTDVNNCGGCNVACSATVGNGSQVDSCLNGVCRYSCLAGFLDLNGDVSLGSAGDGCEYSCTVTNGGVEACDGVDNDCDGVVDEAPGGGVLTQSCYTGPNGTQGVGLCASGTQTCIAGSWGGCLGEVLPAAEVCDGVDNDCDAQTDEDGTGSPLTQACYTGPPSTLGVGLCTGGTQTCSGGAYGACLGQTTPQQETCDGVDNDCDSQIDEDFDTTSDLANCGGCGVACAGTAGAFSYPTACVAGACQYACQSSHHDLNGDVALGAGGNGCEYACTLTNGGVERCGDGVDNDCDNQIDEGFDLQNDPVHCGACSYACAAHEGPNSTQTGCASGLCQFACDTGFVDLNGDVGNGDTGNGCEYPCVTSNGGVEACDGVDNDCDGSTDEGFDLQGDVNNCGSCGYSCAAHAGLNSTATACVAGGCQYVCDSGFYDLNGDLAAGDNGNGCEYACTTSNGGVEACDGADNDCDGATDEAAGGGSLTQVCYTPGYGPTTGCTAQGVCVGTCREGIQTCSGGAFGACVGEISAQVELCDGADNDCDGSVDEDYDVTSDINNCGACAQSCWATTPPNSYPSACVGGSCVYACSSGFNDLNGDLNSGGNGCEYSCPVNPPVTEYCDGVDNDCDGAVDEGLTAPVGYCYQGQAGSPCDGVTPLCLDPDGAGPLAHSWYCQWPAAVEYDPANPNALLGYETRCDGQDGDCDGVADENFTLLGTPCDDGGIGACKGTGTYVCNAAQDAEECTITTPGSAPGTEECNGIDDDCDGVVDNDTPGDMVHVVNGPLDYWIDVYESSRPDATPLGSGSDNDRACSEPDRLPWSNVSWTEADAACAAQGKRLCTEDEWQEGCQGVSAYAYPYGDLYDPDACNGRAYDHDCTPPDDNEVLATGTPYGCPAPMSTQCIGEYLTIDMSGNLMEWTSEDVGSATPMYRVRGGSFDNIGAGMTCQFSFISAGAEFRYSDLGFRCCSDTFPP